MTATAILAFDRRTRETSEADRLRATFDLEATTFTETAPLAMTVTNYGLTNFWDVRVYRCAHIKLVDGYEGLRWYCAELAYVDVHSRYTWTVEQRAQLVTGLHPHPRSFETFVHRGIQYARYRRTPLRRVNSFTRRELTRRRTEFELTHAGDLINLRYDSATVEKNLRL